MYAKWLRPLFMSAVLVMLAGCVVANAVYEPSTDLNVSAVDNLNPDYTGRPSPVVMKVYQLNGRSAFDASDFFNLYGDAASALGNELVKVDDFELQPGEKRDIKLRLSGKTRFIGVVVAYRDIENAQWRLVLDADPTGYKDVSLKLDALAISTKG
ncbi:type VI secretion system lipoprotein TssJ [Gallaecimonas pentaromativorans]|uniref:Type VI secretion system protein VasD n=1 Tax=Gallaecimonas pentaromativorans TaxID=584787 RepID=A0A3N1Q1A9_9GAMM|nr:type VI secretion system lipoprotein TssJ [Gallaecimonas pentaromativorans]MED5523432.1 type VI secretion system lipoprotein TssJ [Pseudomonadota bacterium]ROQ30616.1 type VI secretion system protein VasD [Gallaecimonas pentaromativorans]